MIQLPAATLAFEKRSSAWPEKQHFCPCTEQPSLCLALTLSRWAAASSQSHTRSLRSPRPPRRVLGKTPQSFRETWGEQLSSCHGPGARMLTVIVNLLIILSMQKDVHNLAFQMSPCRSILISQTDKSGCGLSPPHSPSGQSWVCITDLQHEVS